MESDTLNYGAARQKGLTLIELLIAMVIGIVLLGGIIQTMLASKEASATRQSISTITDNARFLFDFMARDLRMAGRGYCNAAETDAFPDGCDDFQWPSDADGVVEPVELSGGMLYVRYETFADADNDGDTEPVFVEVSYSISGEDVVYERKLTDAIDSDKYDYGELAAVVTSGPLVSGVSGFDFEFARYQADGTYEYTAAASVSGWDLDEWQRVTAMRVFVVFDDVDPWGEGIESKSISSTFAMRNQVSRWIP